MSDAAAVCIATGPSIGKYQHRFALAQLYGSRILQSLDTRMRRTHRFRDHQIEVHAGSVQELAVDSERTVELRHVAGRPHHAATAVRELQHDTASAQQHHGARVPCEVREGTARVDVSDAHAPAKFIGPAPARAAPRA